MIILIACIALPVAWFVAALFVFVLPVQQPLRHADALVTLAPAGTRLPTAQAAFDEGLADSLWISHVPREPREAGDVDAVEEACASTGQHSASTICFAPRSDNTIGEARKVAELVHASGADSVIVTTDVTHSARAKYIFKKCMPTNVELQMLLVKEHEGRRRLFERMVYETGAFIKAIMQTRSC